MKLYFIFLIFILVGCGNTVEKSRNVIGEEDINVPIPSESIEKTILVPDGAISGNFIEGSKPFYAHIKKIDRRNETTVIAFEGDKYQPIIIPESVGAQLEILKLENFKQDLLLINAKLKDTNFNEYYLYQLKENEWRPVMNRFDIHKSNMSDTLVPIAMDPADSTKLVRYYSAFDLDNKSTKKFTWMLFRESIKIEE